MEWKHILVYFFLRGLEIVFLAGGLVVDDKRSGRCFISMCVAGDKEEILRSTRMSLVEL